MENTDYTLQENSMKKCFILDIEPWKRPLLVISGGGVKDIIEASEVFGETNKVIYDVKSDPPDVGDGACHWHKDGETIIWLEDWKSYFNEDKKLIITMDDLERLSLVVHETNHVLFDLSRYVGFVDEPEGNAYTQQNIWLEIVKRLSE